jgi:hypothetical protein
MVAVMTLTGAVVVDHLHHHDHNVLPIIGVHGVAALAMGATALVVVPGLWILRDGTAMRRRAPPLTTAQPRSPRPIST